MSFKAIWSRNCIPACVTFISDALFCVFCIVLHEQIFQYSAVSKLRNINEKRHNDITHNN